MLNKRVLFVISSQHFIVHGGIGQFAKGFKDICRELNWQVDYALDKEPADTELANYVGIENIIYPTNGYSYSSHNSTFMFHDSINYERGINLRNAVIKAHQTRIYDMIIVNSLDAVEPVYNLGLSDYIPVVYYTHSEFLIFEDIKDNLILKSQAISQAVHMMSLPGITVGTQSRLNKELISARGNIDVNHLPMPLPEKGLETQSNNEKSGVLFIGRFEERKKPITFIDAVVQANLPAKIMTSVSGVKKFEKEFKKRGYTDYEIKAGIMGDEKVQFIQSAKLAFHPSILESYGFACLETIYSCETIVLDKYLWVKNFDGLVTKASSKSISKVLTERYSQDYSPPLGELSKLQKEIPGIWNSFLESYSKEGSSVQSSQFDKELEEQTSMSISNWSRLLNRELVLFEIIALYKRKHNYKIIQTETDSHFSIDGSYKESKKKTLF